MANLTFSQVATGAALAIVAIPPLVVSCSHLPENSASIPVKGPGGGVCPDAGYCYIPDSVTIDVDARLPPAMACTDMAYGDPWTPGYQEDPAVQGKVGEIIDSLSITELAQQMRGTSPDNNQNYGDIFRSTDNVNKDIRGFHFRDGPRGVCLAAQLPTGDQGYSTAFPVPEARAASFDLALEEKIGGDIADEVVASGSTMLLAPVINILRHPAWGRAQETYGEDSYVLGRFGSAFTTGAQQWIPVCAKHYAANNVEDGRAFNVADMDEQTLREMYARHFGVVIEDAGVSCVMAAYNLVNGIKNTLNHHLLTDILRTDFNFQGLVLSDWWAMPPGQATATTDTLQSYAIEGVNAGLDMELPWAYNYGQLEAVTGPQEPLNQHDLAVSAARILRQKFRFNVENLGSHLIGLQQPTTYIDSTGSIANSAPHVADAEQAALEGMVLLQNKDNTLPIDTSTVRTIAVIGAMVPFIVPGTLPPSGTIDFARTVRLGDLGSSRVFSDPAKSTGPFEGISQQAPQGVTVIAGNSVMDAQNANPDLIIAVVGLTPQDEGEEYTGAGDRTSFDLDDKNTTAMPPVTGPVQTMLIDGLIALNKPIVVVVEAGANINMPWLSEVDSVVMAWYPGQQGGDALGQLLFGKTNFSGKLPLTWPMSWSQEPEFTGNGATLTDDYHVGYAWFDYMNLQSPGNYMPLFYFGDGLSYTTFSYSNLFIPCTTVTSGGVVAVTVDITNTGTVAGDETAFLFISFPGSNVRQGIVKELKSFARTSILPGQTQRVTLPIRVSDLKYWNMTTNAWSPATGPVQVLVGPSSEHLNLTGMFTVQ